MTKNTMARVVVQALYGMYALPEAASPRVRRWERVRKDQLEKLYLKAEQVVSKRGQKLQFNF